MVMIREINALGLLNGRRQERTLSLAQDDEGGNTQKVTIPNFNVATRTGSESNRQEERRKEPGW